jgi:hypothetical protein
VKPGDASPLHYCAPTVVFGLLTLVEGWFPADWYPIAYAVKIVAVTATLLVFRTPLRDIRWNPALVLPSVAIGAMLIALWIGIDTRVPYPHMGRRVAFDPYSIANTLERWTFLAFRLYGLVVLVPVMEELFWRSFVLRYATTADFRSLSLGSFSATGLLVMVAVSALSHPEWLVAALVSLVLAWWLRRTRNLLAPVVAHAAANAGLGVFVLVTREWKYW